ncbi:hypothetical protein [Tissierella pigra]|uniref:hypothetical protein n=1 Tax=Tissierella pigra TaxID=2607614 RepID=UPI0012B3605F|nr:hypothetical protein [Tissierella pigra]
MKTKPKNQSDNNTIPFAESPKELHGCLDCVGCLCVEFCKQEEEKYFGKKEGDLNE